MHARTHARTHAQKQNARTHKNKTHTRVHAYKQTHSLSVSLCRCVCLCLSLSDRQTDRQRERETHTHTHTLSHTHQISNTLAPLHRVSEPFHFRPGVIVALTPNRHGRAGASLHVRITFLFDHFTEPNLSASASACVRGVCV